MNQQYEPITSPTASIVYFMDTIARTWLSKLVQTTRNSLARLGLLRSASRFTAFIAITGLACVLLFTFRLSHRMETLTKQFDAATSKHATHDEATLARLATLESTARQVRLELEKLNELESNVQDVAANATQGVRAELRRSVDAVHGRIDRISDTIPDVAQEKRLEVVEHLRHNIVAVGIKFVDSDGIAKFHCIGTGFVLKQVRSCITAAHVVEELEQRLQEYRKKDLRPQIAAKLSEGRIGMISDRRTHKLFPTRAKRDASASHVLFPDIGRLEIDNVGALSDGLVVATDVFGVTVVKVGQEVATAGFPTAVNTISYPQDANSVLSATVRFGQIERLSGFDTKQIGVDVIQHNIPLVGGFSGSPIVNMDGEVIGIASYSSHRYLKADEVLKGGRTLSGGTLRLLDAAHINFAINAGPFREWLTATLD